MGAHYDSTRLTAPLLRRKKRGEEEWVQVTWSEALDHIATSIESRVGAGAEFNVAVQKVLEEIITDHGAVVAKALEPHVATRTVPIDPGTQVGRFRIVRLIAQVRGDQGQIVLRIRGKLGAVVPDPLVELEGLRLEPVGGTWSEKVARRARRRARA